MAQAETRESVIVVLDANRSKGNMDALDWALKHAIRRQDTVIVLGVSSDFGKKNSCFPLNMGISISGIWERLEFSSQGQGEARPRELGEKIERKKEEYQNNLQPFYRQCKKNEVNMEVILAFGFCPQQIAIEQAQKSNPRWIVLDSYLKKHKVIINAHTGCNVAVVKGKDVATLTPSKPSGNSIQNSNSTSKKPEDNNNYQESLNNSIQEDDDEEEEEDSSGQPLSPCWYPLSWQSGFPRVFSQTEIEEITNGFAEHNFFCEEDTIRLYEGIVQDSPILIKCFLENDERFRTMLKILSRVRHRNISNLVGYCSTGTSAFLIFDYPCLGTLAMSLTSEPLARNLPWKARWYIAIEIGGSLRYLHEECVDGGAIVHLSLSSSAVVFFNGCTSMLANFVSARLLKDDDSSNNEDSKAECDILEVDEGCARDLHDYGVLLIELISGKNAQLYQNENEGQSLINWALPLIEKGHINEVLDPRLENSSDARVVHHMIKAALLCLKNDMGQKISMSDVLAVVRGEKLAMTKY